MGYAPDRKSVYLIGLYKTKMKALHEICWYFINCNLDRDFYSSSFALKLKATRFTLKENYETHRNMFRHMYIYQFVMLTKWMAKQEGL